MKAENNKNIIIPGGAGYLGKALAAYFSQLGYSIVILSRRAQTSASSSIRFLEWDGENIGAWQRQFEGASAIINLAGRTVNCRYNETNKQEIYDSRLKSTKIIGEAIAQCASPPSVWLNASSATIYRDAEDRAMDEVAGEIGTGFSVDVCQRWERVLNDAQTPHTRKVALRTSIVFGKGQGGPFEAFRNVVKLGLGGTLGKGTQFVSWIHLEDFCRSLQWILEYEGLTGAINLASPNPLKNSEFMRDFREACGMPVGLPAMEWMLEIGAFFLQTETELLLKSRRVVPTRMLASGFVFKYPEFKSALSEICQ